MTMDTMPAIVLCGAIVAWAAAFYIYLKLWNGGK
jgi:hypothetical protein